MQMMNYFLATTVVWGVANVSVGQTPPQFEDHHLFASDGVGGDTYGSSVSISGDVAIVGVPADDTAAGSWVGSAFIYRLSGSSWVEEAHLFAPNGEAFDTFGKSVAISGNLAVVGAPRNDVLGLDAGSAYVYLFDGADWILNAQLFASDGEGGPSPLRGDRFGWSVSASTNVVIIGASGDNTSSGVDAGSAYVFRKNGINWVEEAHLFASGGSASEYYGRSVSISGDTAIIGAQGDDSGGTTSASVYIYRFDGAIWNEEAHLTATSGAKFDNFGSSVSISGDVAIVGATQPDAPGNLPGSAYIYRFNGTSWVEESQFFGSSEAIFDGYGKSVSISGDVAIVCAPWGQTDKGIMAGLALLYRYNGLIWAEELHLFASDRAAWDQFGWSVSVSENIVMAGSRFDEVMGETQVGSVYVFDVSPICTGDIIPTGGDGVVDIIDLMAVLNAFGPCSAPPAPCPADITPPGPPIGNGTVNIDDLVAILNAFGPCH